ncbi:MAG: hypothetical protein ACI83D_000095 [Planctomycetota bacterium]|jgi:hypothetical protein
MTDSFLDKKRIIKKKIIGAKRLSVKDLFFLTFVEIQGLALEGVTGSISYIFDSGYFTYYGDVSTEGFDCRINQDMKEILGIRVIDKYVDYMGNISEVGLRDVGFLQNVLDS